MIIVASSYLTKKPLSVSGKVESNNIDHTGLYVTRQIEQQVMVGTSLAVGYDL